MRQDWKNICNVFGGKQNTGLPGMQKKKHKKKTKPPIQGMKRPTQSTEYMKDGTYAAMSWVKKNIKAEGKS